MSRRGTSAGASPGSEPTLFDGSSGTSTFHDDPGDIYPGATPRSAIAVSTLTQTVKDVVEGAFIPLWVRGEVTDFKSHRNGHWYFSLRDESSQLKCVVWSRDQRGIPAPPDEGMQLTALGQVGVYASRGDLQFTVKRIEAEGDGLWLKALEATRARLDADGLLAPGRKRPLPRLPKCIAVVTSVSGAALRDIVAVLKRRAPGVQVVVSHAAVQGEAAPLELRRGLARVVRWGGADLVIIGRGGGSREDLWAFNDERLVRAVAACPVPTISAVGHEIDMSLCDLVADLRAPTPSAAAEAAVTSRDEIAMVIRGIGRRMARSVGDRLYESRARAASAAHGLAGGASDHLRARRQKLGALSGRLNALSPLATLERGYVVATDETGRTLSSASDFRAKMAFTLRTRDGEVEGIVRATRHGKKGVA